MDKPSDISEDSLAIQALAFDDPDLQSIKDQLRNADPKLREVLEDYMARWFQYSHPSAIM